MKVLLFSSVAPTQNFFRAFESWQGEGIDIALCAYMGGDIILEHCQGRIKYFYEREGYKIPNFLYFLDQQKRDIIGDYEYVILIDDDLSYSSIAINSMIQCMQRTETEIASPANTGQTHWESMRQKKDLKYEFTNFIEMGFLVFSQKKLREFVSICREVKLIDEGIDILLTKKLFTNESPFLLYHEHSYHNPPTNQSRKKAHSFLARLFKSQPTPRAIPRLLGSNHLPETRVITLSITPERREMFIKAWENIALSYRFSEGVNGTMNQFSDMYWSIRYNRYLRSAEVGCLLSHRAIWESYQDDSRGVIIMEDDVGPSRGSYPLEDTFRTMKELGGELLYMLKTKNLYHDKWFSGVVVSKNISRAQTTGWGTGCYWISSDGMKRALEMTKGLDYLADGIYEEFCQKNVIYFLDKPFAKENFTYSLIQPSLYRSKLDYVVNFLKFYFSAVKKFLK